MSGFDYSDVAKERLAYLEALSIEKFEPRGFYITSDPVLRLRKLSEVPPIDQITHTDPQVIDLVIEAYSGFLPTLQWRWFVCGAAAAALFVDPRDKENVRTMLTLLTDALVTEYDAGQEPRFPALASHLRGPVEETFSRTIAQVEPSQWHQFLAYMNGFFWVLTHVLPPLTIRKARQAFLVAAAFILRTTDTGTLPS